MKQTFRIKNVLSLFLLFTLLPHYYSNFQIIRTLDYLDYLITQVPTSPDNQGSAVEYSGPCCSKGVLQSIQD